MSWYAWATLPNGNIIALQTRDKAKIWRLMVSVPNLQVQITFSPKSARVK